MTTKSKEQSPLRNKIFFPFFRIFRHFKTIFYLGFHIAYFEKCGNNGKPENKSRRSIYT